MYLEQLEAGRLVPRPYPARAQTSATAMAETLTTPRDVTEQDLLDLEREQFLSLLGTKETQERIAYTLKTGKPLRN